ncbi:hypothetical protein ED733_001181 [Metarhizium rileyi]|nr:hypothetical protein ED733_001181 [Metarhizium rileyi]
MGSLPILKRRLCFPSFVIVASFLSILFVTTFLSRPAYFERFPEVLPSLENQLPGFGDKKGGAESHVSSKNKGWKFNSDRDANTYSLDSEQCNIAFPGLFAEIERGVATQKALGNITPKQLNISGRGRGALRGMIVDQQLYVLQETILENEYDTSRAVAILHAIHRAIITSPEPLPNIEFAFTVSDVVPDPDDNKYPIWGLTRKAADEEIWLMGDFGYWSWPLDLVGAYNEVRQKIAEAETKFEQKTKQAVWRGAVATNGHREELIKVTEKKDWADVRAIVWAGISDLISEDQTKALSMPEHCKYQFVIHTEGHSYSGRGKYLQNCNSVVIMHKRTWIEPHHALLVAEGPKQNFVEVAEDFSDLEAKVTGLLARPAKAKKIAQNGADTFRDRYLTPASQTCYWRELIRGWSSVSFEPELWNVDKDDGKRTIRGVPFETFV